MVARNPHLAKLRSGYLFPEINKRKKALLERVPDARLISLGIGDTTEPIPSSITDALKKGAERLGTIEGYSGYGPEQGNEALRDLISTRIYGGRISPNDIFVSDGSKCDIARLQLLFGSQHIAAIQDPSYPPYVDTSVIIGQGREYNNATGQYGGLIMMSCTPENNFFPDLNALPPSDIIYFCSPNNPTGMPATFEQLKALVEYAKKHDALIIFDAAYACYIQDPHLPRSIYEIEGARECAIELGSFSKMTGFTGVRLGWNVVPKTLKFDDGSSIHSDWSRIVTTCFNGASNIAQSGGIAALSPKGWEEMQGLIHFYMENAALLKDACESLGLKVFGGSHTPYLWVEVAPHSSWGFFQALLESAHIVTTPGSGFGSKGEGFLRLSAFGHRKNILEAIDWLKRYVPGLLNGRVL